MPLNDSYVVHECEPTCFINVARHESEAPPPRIDIALCVVASLIFGRRCDEYPGQHPKLVMDMDECQEPDVDTCCSFSSVE